MEKLRIEKEGIYEIEVNDNGDTIQIDLLDLDLPSKIVKASIELGEKYDEYIKEQEEIAKEYKDDEINRLLKSSESEKKYCIEMRKSFDSFLGKNACQKIFGDTNRIAMFDKLMYELEKNHFPKMKIDMKTAKEKLVKKYMPHDKNVM